MKLGMIGKRGHSHYVFESIGEVPGLTIAGIAATEPAELAILREACDSTGFAPAEYQDYRALLESHPDLVCIDGPFDRHGEMCIAALEAGCHVFCEKPLAFTLAEIDQIEALATQKQLRVGSMTALRYDEPFQTAARLAAEGAVGEIRSLQAQKSYKFGVRPEFYRERATYGGTIGWVGSHGLDLILGISGRKIRSVRALQSSRGNHGTGSMEVTAQCLFELEEEVIATLSIDILRPDCAASWGDDRLRIAGTGGILEGAGGRLTLIDAKGAREIAADGPVRHIFSDFAIELAGGRPALVDNQAAFELARGTILAQRSADLGGAVVIPGEEIR